MLQLLLLRRRRRLPPPLPPLLLLLLLRAPNGAAAAGAGAASGGGGSGARTVNALECPNPNVPQVDGQPVFTCGPATGLGCQLDEYPDGLPLRIALRRKDGDNKTELCEMNLKVPADGGKMDTYQWWKNCTTDLEQLRVGYNS